VLITYDDLVELLGGFYSLILAAEQDICVLIIFLLSKLLGNYLGLVRDLRVEVKSKRSEPDLLNLAIFAEELLQILSCRVQRNIPDKYSPLASLTNLEG